MTRRFCDLCDKPAMESEPRKHIVFSRSDIAWSEPLPQMPDAYKRFEHGTAIQVSASFLLSKPAFCAVPSLLTGMDICPGCARLLLGKLLESVK